MNLYNQPWDGSSVGDWSIRLWWRMTKGSYPLCCCGWCSCTAGHCGRAPQGSPVWRDAPSSTPSPAPAPPCWEPPAGFWTGRNPETETDCFSLFWYHHKLGTYVTWKQLRPTCTDSTQAPWGCCLLAPGSTVTETSSQWALIDWVTMVTQLFVIYYITVCTYYTLKIMHHLQLYLFKYLPFSISVHMT